MLDAAAQSRLSPSLRAALKQANLGPSLRALCLFGSCVQPETSAADPARGVPDLLAILDDGALTPWLRRQGHGWLLQHLSRHLPPLTLALARDGVTVAKLNLIEAGALRRAIDRLPDLYLAGRLSKPLRPLQIRDDACARELGDTAQRAAQQIARQVLRDLPTSCLLPSLIPACVALSYRAELRPEGPRKLDALFAAHRDFFIARFAPLLREQARRLGIDHDAASDRLDDRRPSGLRQLERFCLLHLLWRSRLRSLLRWPKQMLAFSGWHHYAIDKLRRARRAERTR